MKKTEDLICELMNRRAQAVAMGGPEKVRRQRERGKLTVRERVEELLDLGSFLEYGILATHTGALLDEPITPADAVITGTGRIQGRPIAIYAEDATVLGGSVDEVNLKKRTRMIELAHQEKIPLISLLDGAGFRAQSVATEVGGSLAMGHLMTLARHSSVSPTVAVVMGACAGGPALEAALATFSIMVEGNGMIAAGGPPVVKASTGVEVTKEELGGASIHVKGTGTIDNAVANDIEALATVREFLAYLPTNSQCFPPSKQSVKKPAGSNKKLIDILPESLRLPYDMHEVIEQIVDEGSFLEIKPQFGAALIVGLARLNGHPVGVTANQPQVRAGAVGAKEAQKFRKFIELCSSFHIPMVSLVDTPGVMTGPDSEREASLKHGLAAAYARAWADIPSFSVILRKAFGFGGGLMTGQGCGQSLTLAWPTVSFASLPADSAIDLLHSDEIALSEDPAGKRDQLLQEFAALSGPFPAAQAAVIDDVILPEETRAKLIQALEVSLSRRGIDAEQSYRGGVMP